MSGSPSALGPQRKPPPRPSPHTTTATTAIPDTPITSTPHPHRPTQSQCPVRAYAMHATAASRTDIAPCDALCIGTLHLLDELAIRFSHLQP